MHHTSSFPVCCSAFLSMCVPNNRPSRGSLTLFQVPTDSTCSLFSATTSATSNNHPQPIAVQPALYFDSVIIRTQKAGVKHFLHPTENALFRERERERERVRSISHRRPPGQPRVWSSGPVPWAAARRVFQTAPPIAPWARRREGTSNAFRACPGFTRSVQADHLPRWFEPARGGQ